MSKLSLARAEFLSADSIYNDNSNASIIAIGDRERWEEGRHELPSEEILFCTFEGLTAELLDCIRPSSIFSPIVAKNFDCIELAMTLHNLGYTGAYRAYASKLPKPELIEREVAFICPKLDFRIILPN